MHGQQPDTTEETWSYSGEVSCLLTPKPDNRNHNSCRLRQSGGCQCSLTLIPYILTMCSHTSPLARPELRIYFAHHHLGMGPWPIWRWCLPMPELTLDFSFKYQRIASVLCLALESWFYQTTINREQGLFVVLVLKCPLLCCVPITPTTIPCPVASSYILLSSRL